MCDSEARDGTAQSPAVVYNDLPSQNASSGCLRSAALYLPHRVQCPPRYWRQIPRPSARYGRVHAPVGPSTARRHRRGRGCCRGWRSLDDSAHRQLGVAADRTGQTNHVAAPPRGSTAEPPPVPLRCRSSDRTSGDPQGTAAGGTHLR